MIKLKEYFKLFTYIFYPGIVVILYLAQGLEGKLSSNLIFCPTDIIVMIGVLGIYLLFDYFKVFDKKIFRSMKRNDGRLKIPYLVLMMIVIVLLMQLYDDLKVYFYLNIEVNISLFIIGMIWLILLAIAFLLNKIEK